MKIDNALESHTPLLKYIVILNRKRNRKEHASPLEHTWMIQFDCFQYNVRLYWEKEREENLNFHFTHSLLDFVSLTETGFSGTPSPQLITSYDRQRIHAEFRLYCTRVAHEEF